jgi:dinuclear metal center YbgI/SA1388 family protein
MAQTRELVAYLHDLLEADAIGDYTPNGLQLEGAVQIQRLMTGVTACQALLDAAADWRADALLVHHGWFWKNEAPQITGMKRHRLATALGAGFNLIAYHLPLDVHATYGNNAELGHRLGAEVKGTLDIAGVPGLLWYGTLDEPVSASALGERLGEQLQRAPLHIAGGAEPIARVAWCTGAGQDFIDAAADLGVDAYISGEIAERTTHTARERGIHYFSAGHHATERDGVRVLGEHLAARFGLEHRFVDIDNPV